jgi:hypothetical protein
LPAPSFVGDLKRDLARVGKRWPFADFTAPLTLI